MYTQEVKDLYVVSNDKVTLGELLDNIKTLVEKLVEKNIDPTQGYVYIIDGQDYDQPNRLVWMQ